MALKWLGNGLVSVRVETQWSLFTKPFPFVNLFSQNRFFFFDLARPNWGRVKYLQPFNLFIYISTKLYLVYHYDSKLVQRAIHTTL